MNRKSSFFYFPVFIVVFSLLVSSCTRINETTDLGDGLIPAVDNINTFDTLITVETYNDSFRLASADRLLTDSFRMIKSDIHVLGKISNDPLFGSTDAKIYLQLKPLNYKYAFENHTDSLFIDSVVLVLDYVQSFGDTNVLQSVNVFEMAQSPTRIFKFDSNYLIRNVSFPTSTLLGQKIFAPSILNDSIKAFRDTTKNQLRIRLDNNFGDRLLDYDSSATGAYFSDSAFRSKFRGFAIESTSGNALMGFDLASGKTKLAIYYRFKNVPRQDTTVRYFTFNAVSANANYVTRNNYIGSPAFSTFGGGQDDLVYLQNTPGTFTKIKIPDLLTVSNRVVHRAELIAEQVYHSSDALFTTPTGLMLDVLDTALKNYRYMPYDFSFDPQSGSTNLLGFGSFGKIGVDGSGNAIRVWKFDISRYVQNALTRREPFHELRLFTAYQSFDLYQPTIFSQSGFINPIALNTVIAMGRVRLAGGNYVDATRRMRIRIVYSKL